MIFNIDWIAPKKRQILQGLASMRPVPQRPVWENMAAKCAQEGDIREASCLLDLLAIHYGKSAARTISERIFSIETAKKGLGLTHDCAQTAHPAVFALRDQLHPLWVGGWVALRENANIRLVRPTTSAMRRIHALSQTPSMAPILSSQTDPVQWCAVGGWLFFSNGSPTLHALDLSHLPSDSEDFVLPHTTCTFETPIHRMCGPLSDGSLFITRASSIPILSDTCCLCRFDLQKISAHLKAQTATDMVQMGALESCLELPNVEQTLEGDCIACGDQFMTCGGGMQSAEVRFISASGAWKTKFVHDSPVIRVLNSERGGVSLDQKMHAFLWQQGQVVDDLAFPAELLPEPFRSDLDAVQFSIDWGGKRLYLTRTEAAPATLSATLNASYSCCLTAQTADMHASVKHLVHLPGATLALLADGSYYFWDRVCGCVDARWQLPAACAEAENWRQLLASSVFSSVESDPRIRELDPRFTLRRS